MGCPEMHGLASESNSDVLVPTPFFLEYILVFYQLPKGVVV